MKRIIIVVFLINTSTLMFAQEIISPAEYEQKISKLRKEFRSSPSAKILDHLYDTAKEAYEQYQDSAKFASCYSIAFYNKKDDPGEAIEILLLFLHEKKEPYVVYTIWRIFHAAYRSIRVNGDRYLQVSNWSFLFKGSEAPAYDAFLVIYHHWAMEVDDDIIPPSLKKKVNEARKIKVSGKLSFVGAWRQVIKNLLRYRNGLNAYQRVIEQNNAAAVNSVEVSNAKTQAEAFDKSLQNLDLFLIPPNSLQKIELTLNKVMRFRRKFKKYPEIPNYEELKEKYRNSDEAEVLDAAYKSYILGDYKGSLQRIEKIKDADADPRSLAIKIYCQEKLKYPTEEIISNLNKLLELEPQNSRAFMLKKMIEAKIELQQRAKEAGGR